MVQQTSPAVVGVVAARASSVLRAVLPRVMASVVVIRRLALLLAAATPASHRSVRVPAVLMVFSTAMALALIGVAGQVEDRRAMAARLRRSSMVAPLTAVAVEVGVVEA